MPASNYKAQFGLTIEIDIYNELQRNLARNTKPQNKQILCRISPRIVCNPRGYTMKISSSIIGV